MRGLDVLTAQEANVLSTSDAEQLAFAGARGRVIFTQDADFLPLHVKGIPHNGIIYAQQQSQIGHIIRGLMLVSQILAPEDMRNHIEFL